MWDNVEKLYRAGEATDKNVLRRMRLACYVTKDTDTNSEYAERIDFPRQQW